MLRRTLLLLCLSLGLSLTGAPVSAAPPAPAPVILVLGDSLSAGYGLDANTGWVFLLERRLKTQGLPHRVVNASVSGETTAGGLARLPALLERHRPQLVLVELGGNDGLRALPVKQMKANLERIVDSARAAKAEPVLFEMLIPENYGPAYRNAFTQAFTQVSQSRKAALVPFLLSSFATDPRAFQDDGIHPGVGAQAAILDTVWPHLLPLLKR